MERELRTLNNGTTEVESLVSVVMMSLRKLFDEKPMVLFDLVSKCRDSSYKWFGDAEQICRDLKLVEPENPYNSESGGTIHQSIKNIVLSAAEGEGMDMTLVSPYADNHKPKYGMAILIQIREECDCLDTPDMKDCLRCEGIGSRDRYVTLSALKDLLEEIKNPKPESE